MPERPARRADLAAVTTLYCAYERAVLGAPDTDPDDVTAYWDQPGLDLARDSLVVEQDGRVVGYAVRHGAETDSVVAPELRTSDLPARLLDWLEQAGTALEHFQADADEVLSALMPARGWSPARRFWRMRRELSAPLPEPVWPPGVGVRGYLRQDDDVEVHRLITTCFAEIGGQRERTLEQWRAFLYDSRFDPSLHLVAVCGQQVVGAALSQDVQDFGYVRQLAVAPAQRGLGVGLALLHECFRRHAARGLPATVLGVDAANPTGALRLYEKAGMRVHEHFTRWERPARPVTAG